MNRKLKSLALLFAAALLVAAVAGATAATAAQFHSEIENTTLTGTQNEEPKFGFAAGTVKCKIGKYEGTVTAKTAESFELAPTYGECLLAGLPTVIDMNGCKYDFTVFKFSVDLVCPPKKQMEFTIFSCTIDVPPQELTGWTFITIPKPPYIIPIPTFKKIKYTQTGTKCLGNGGAASKSFEEGTYTGEFTLIGENSGGVQVGIWIE